MKHLKYVNVFQGTGKYVKPSADGLYARWNLLKGKAGNTSPAACLPFGNVACSPYSGGYPVGYGNHKLNGGREVETFFEGNRLFGFSHFTHSGTGAIGIYYNYLVTTPFTGSFAKVPSLKEFDGEYAKPGYYACRFKEEDITCEVSVADKVALHRYTSNTGAPIKIAVDVSNNGLRQKKDILHGKATRASFKAYEDGSVGGAVAVEGITLYFYVAVTGGCRAKLFQKRKFLKERELALENADGKFGFVLECKGAKAEMKVGFSLVGEENAKRSALAAKGFDETAEAAERAWAERLGAIELFGVSDEDKEIFYSNYYHTLVKPCGWAGESFLWEEKETFYLDFATLWDVYKTQLPLVFTLYGDVAKGILKTLLRYGKEHGGLFNALLMSTDRNVESQQACCLGCYVLYDGYVRGWIDEADVEDMFAVVKAEVDAYADAVQRGGMEKTTKLLDVCLIAQAFASLARSLKRKDDERYFARIAKYWTKAFGKTGLLKTRYPYYEGNRWNYSFRFVNDVEKRIALGGGKERVRKQLDAFFAFEEGNRKADRFEGFNNETDMETPYFYHYVGAYDRLAVLLSECVNVCFRTGRDGLPGNNDSGGLSACYLWNFLGLFPISGQDAFFVGVPKAEKAVLHLAAGKDLVVCSVGEGEGVEKVVFNGKALDGYAIAVSEIMNGGELTYFKKEIQF